MSTLAQLRSECLNTGFDVNAYSSRITGWLNDAASTIARKAEWYGEEGIYAIPTANAVSTYAWPADLAKVRSVITLAADPSPSQELQRVSLADIDRSPAASGHPWYYAVDGPNLHLFPVPDTTAYALELRYWKLPPALVNDSDVPVIPADYHSMLVFYALARCYERDDDTTMAAYYDGRWAKSLADLKTDLTFPSSEEPHQVAGLWDAQPVLSVSKPNSWVWGW